MYKIRISEFLQPPRKFSTFLLRDPVSIKFLNWLQSTYIPDEHFYSTLATVSSSDLKRGLVTQNLNCNCTHGGCVRKSWWIYKADDRKCTGKVIRAICHFGTADLPRLRKEAAAKRCLTANKFDLDVDAVAVVCQARDIVQRTEALYMGLP